MKPTRIVAMMLSSLVCQIAVVYMALNSRKEAALCLLIANILVDAYYVGPAFLRAWRQL